MEIENDLQYRRQMQTVADLNAFFKSAGSYAVAQTMGEGVKAGDLSTAARDHLARAFSENELSQASSLLRSGQGQVSAQVQFSVSLSDGKAAFVGVGIPPGDLPRFRELFGASKLGAPVRSSHRRSLPPNLVTAVRDLTFDPKMISRFILRELTNAIAQKAGIKLIVDERTSEFRLITTATNSIDGAALLLKLEQCFSLEWRRVDDVWFLGPPSLKEDRGILMRMLQGQTQTMLSELELNENADVPPRTLAELNEDQKEFLARLFAGSPARGHIDSILKMPGATISGGAIVHVNYSHDGALMSFSAGH